MQRAGAFNYMVIQSLSLGPPCSDYTSFCDESSRDMVCSNKHPVSGTQSHDKVPCVIHYSSVKLVINNVQHLYID